MDTVAEKEKKCMETNVFRCGDSLKVLKDFRRFVKMKTFVSLIDLLAQLRSLFVLCFV